MRLIFFLFFCLSSYSLQAQNCSFGPLLKVYRPKYAKHFEIHYFKNIKMILVDNEQYLLSDTPLHCSVPANLSNQILTPVKRVAMTSTTYLPALEMLNQQKSLIAFQGKHYIVSKSFKLTSLKEFSFKFNSEDLIGFKADLIMGYEANLTNDSQKKVFQTLGLPVVINKDMEEKGPLARAEWLIFIASFFNQETEAVRIFQSIEESYLSLKRDNLRRNKKKVIIGEIQSGEWVTCGGESDLAQLITDAGGELAHSRASAKTQKISLEEILLKKTNYDIWLTHNLWESEKERVETMKHDPRYRTLKAIRVYNNNLILNDNKSSDYWETAMQRPDLLLKDLSALFHPEYFPGYQLRWYRKL